MVHGGDSAAAGHLGVTSSEASYMPAMRPRRQLHAAVVQGLGKRFTAAMGVLNAGRKG